MEIGYLLNKTNNSLLHLVGRDFKMCVTAPYWAMLVGCGLRRAEIVTVKIEDFELREEHWILADLIGKGGHMRTVPGPAWVKGTVDVWIARAELGNGTLFRAIGKTGKVYGGGFTRK